MQSKETCPRKKRKFDKYFCKSVFVFKNVRIARAPMHSGFFSRNARPPERSPTKTVQVFHVPNFPATKICMVLWMLILAPLLHMCVSYVGWSTSTIVGVTAAVVVVPCYVWHGYVRVCLCEG